MYDLFQTVLLLSLLGSGVILILLCLKPLLTRTVPPRWQTWLWGLALVVLVLPVYQWISLPQPVPELPVIQIQQDTESPPPQTEPTPPEQTTTPTPQAEPPDTPQKQPLQVESLAPLWLLGVAVFLVILWGSYLRFLWKLLRKSIKISEHSLLDELRRDLGIRRKIPLREAPGLPTPMLVGLFFPVVCLPDPDLPEEHLRMVLLHELTHYKRNDLLLKWLALLVNAVHWFNPLAWLLTRSLGQACEDACDRDVTRNMTPQERKQYMYTILTLAQH